MCTTITIIIGNDINNNDIMRVYMYKIPSQEPHKNKNEVITIKINNK